MKFFKNAKWLYISITFWLITIFTLALWWIYVFLSLASKIEENNIQNIIGENFYRMIKWEGIFFIALLFIISTGVLFLFIKDIKKTRSLQNFFASLTHELKTPLANIKIQSEFLKEILREHPNTKVQDYLQFLTKGSSELEEQFDNLLQLSQIEETSAPQYTNINLPRFIKTITSLPQYSTYQFRIETQGEHFDVYADEFSLKIILKNLLENTRRHAKSESNLIEFSLTELPNKISLSYKDHGKVFQGDFQRLGQLFYKYNSHLGSGIGLYLINKLSAKMKGSFDIQNVNGHLKFEIKLRKSVHE